MTTVLVVNCNHWIGYHIVNTLLENDKKVDGIANLGRSNKPKKGEVLIEEDLSLYYGRNSSFSMIDSDEEKYYEIGIIAGGDHLNLNQKVKKLYVINPEDEEIRSSNDNNFTIIKVPLLFGEWMPMNEKGMFRKEEFIPFRSDYFKKNAVYVRDFAEGILQWLEVPGLPLILHVYSRHYNRGVDAELEKVIYLRENVPIIKRINSVVDHYRLLSNFNN
ncbi:hypothetical protein [Oceanobacillus damuensis]|uniref:hypothetical protein n=1 Tax=Oceanobacillus damuensis TaxID=937928 RepID=UPI00082A1FD0|nr:hypothetical protein [Oceanobacillus damuensis]